MTDAYRTETRAHGTMQFRVEWIDPAEVADYQDRYFRIEVL